nr:unnamed protein product [Haemonchus contortus]
MWGSQMDCTEDGTQSLRNSSGVPAPSHTSSVAEQIRPLLNETPQFGGSYPHSTGDIFHQSSGPQPSRDTSLDNTPTRSSNKTRTFTSQAAHPTQHDNL